MSGYIIDRENQEIVVNIPNVEQLSTTSVIFAGGLSLSDLENEEVNDILELVEAYSPGPEPGPTPPISDVKYFTGNTIIITWAEASLEQRTYKYSSAGNITFSGDLTDFESIEGNGTTNVTVVVKQIPTEYVRHFTITCGTDSDNRVYECELAYWGANLPANKGIMMFETIDESVLSEDGKGVVVHTLVAGTPTFEKSCSTKTVGGKEFVPMQLIGYTFGNYHPTSIPNNFLNYCYQFNQPLDVSNVTSIGNYFLNCCYQFNQPLDVSNVTSIGNYFLGCCYQFDQPLDVSNVTSIGNYFLYYCQSFNQPLDVSNVTSIGDFFLGYCRQFNQPLDVSNVTSIGNYFLGYCYQFNQPLDISNVTSIGNYFLNSCQSFNQQLTIPSSVTSIGNYFLYHCYQFNQQLTIPSSVTSIGNYFLGYCYQFKQPLDVSRVTSIGTSFLTYCNSFNQPLDISNVTSIGNYFLNSCQSFNQQLTIPSSVTSIGNYFLFDCYTFKKLIYEPATYVPASDNNTLAWGDYNRTEPITVSGAGASNLKSRFANKTGSPYRKLVVE